MSVDVPEADWTHRVPLPGRHVVEASAGTGKTFTIATLHLRFVLELGLPVGRVLVATFTEAATAELKDRLRQNLARARRLVGATAPADDATDPADAAALRVLEGVRAAGPDADPAEAARAARRLDRALSAFDAAPVFTLHGFCQRLLTELAFEAGARFEEEVLTDTRPLLDAAVAGFAASAFGDPGSPHAGATPATGSAWGPLRDLARLAVVHPDAGIEPVANDPAVIGPLDQQAAALAEDWSSRGETLAADLRGHAGGFHKALSGNLDRHLAALDAAVRGARWHELPEELGRPYLKKKTLKAGVTPADPFWQNLEEVRSLARSPGADPAIAAQSALAAAARETVARLKREAGVLTFDDLLQRVDAALTDPATGPALAAVVRGRYPVAMIDEVQDTDPLQHRILERLFGEGVGDEPGRSFFSIGDPKQSIYRFRGADVGGFVATRGRTAPARRHGLGVNFRTDAPLVAATQAVFRVAGPAAFGSGGIELPPVGAAHPRRTTLTPALDLAFVRARPAASEQAGFATVEAATPAVTRAVARDVVALLDAGPGIAGNGGGTRLAAGDLAVLCPNKRQLDAVAAALAAAGVPAVRPSGGSVFASPEAAVLVDLAAAWLDPSNLPRLRRAMLGPVLGVPAAGLADPDALAAAAELARDCGRRWRRSGFTAALDRAASASAAVPRLAGRPGGERRLTNLFHLAELIEGMARDGGLEPPAVLARLRRARRAPAEAEAEVGASASAEQRLETDAAAVKLMTIHASKGLEFPVVFLPFLWADTPRKVEPPLAFRPGGDPPEPTVIDLGGDGFAGRAQEEAAAQRDERRRLLYVALTRARHQTRLHLAGTKNASQTPLGALVLEATGGDPPADEAGWRDALDAWSRRVDQVAREDLQHREADDGVAVVGFRDADDRSSLRPVLPTDAAAPPTLSRRRLDRVPPPGLRSSSFSALTAGGGVRHAATPPEAADRDASPDLQALPEATPGPIDAMPGGTGVGSLVHAVLEEALASPPPFGDAPVAAWCRERVATLSERHPLDAAWHAPLGDALAETLERPLPIGGAAAEPVALLGTDPTRRAIELPFVLASGGAGAGELPVDAVAAVLAGSPHAETRAAAVRLRRAGARPIAGFFEGVIDLAVEVDGRWTVVDHKSNRPSWLAGGGAFLAGGDASLAGGDDHPYGQAAMAEAMVGSMYLVQGHLYLAALHRLLGVPAVAGEPYAAGEKLGGMAYLFVRGIARGEEAGPHTPGVYHHRPEPGLIEELADTLKSEAWP